MRRLVVLAAAALAIALAGVVWRWRSVPCPPRLVLLYAPCTVNKRFLSPYNAAVTYTPFLDEFSRDAVVFTKHHTEEAQSGIAYASLFSGRQADGHGIFVHPARLADDLYLITEAFADHGYETFFWGDQPMASPSLNYAQGVKQENVFTPAPVASGKPAERRDAILRASDPRFLRILQRLETDPHYKAFIVANFSVTHQPYLPGPMREFCERYPNDCPDLSPEQLKRRTGLFLSQYAKWSYSFDEVVRSLALSPEEVAGVVAVAELLYKANISVLDRMFGAVMEAIRAHGLLDESLIAFTADHGEALYRATAPLKWTHGWSLGPDDIEVPLIIRSPAVPPGRYESVTRSIDVFPTLAGLAGITLPAGHVAGEDLSAAMRGDVAPPALLAFSHTSLVPVTLRTVPTISARFAHDDPRAMWVAVRDGDLVYKLVSDDGIVFQPHAYDWRTDPAEQVDLYDPANATHARAIEQLSAYKAALIESHSRWKTRAAGRLPDAQQEELLRALGYANDP